MKHKRIFATTDIVSETYLTLRDLDMREEALFLFLTYSLCLSPRCLWFLTAGSITHNNILTYWDLAMEQYKEIILSCQAKKLIESYENELKYQDLSRDWEKRVSNDGKTVIFGMFLFSKKPTCWNNFLVIVLKDLSNRSISPHRSYESHSWRNEDKKWEESGCLFTSSNWLIIILTHKIIHTIINYDHNICLCLVNSKISNNKALVHKSSTFIASLCVYLAN